MSDGDSSCFRQLQLLRRRRLRKRHGFGALHSCAGLHHRGHAQPYVLTIHVQPSLFSFFTCHHVYLLHAAVWISLSVGSPHTHRFGRCHYHYGAVGQERPVLGRQPHVEFCIGRRQCHTHFGVILSTQADQIQ